MRYRFRDLPGLLRSAQGRKSLRAGQLARFWPIIRGFTLLWRRTVLRKVRVVAVIGSLGKSTTARAVAQAIGQRIPDGISNSNNALAMDLLSRSPKDSHAVMEAAVNGPGKMKDNALMLNPDIVIVTSIASEHILSFKTLENTRREKAEMVRSLAPDKTVILNADDSNVMWMKDQTPARVITCGFSSGADIRAEHYRILQDGYASFIIRAERESWTFSTRIPGRHMVFPVLASLATAMVEGRGPSSALENLAGLEPFTGRMQPVMTPSGAMIIRDDFKSNRESVHAALETLRSFPAKRRLLVLGGVDEIRNFELYDFYKNLGREIAESADYAFLFLPKKIFRRCKTRAVEGGISPEKIVRVTGDPLAALPLLPPDLGEGDVLLIKGRNRHRTSRLSLKLSGRKVECRITACLLGVDCDVCELLEQDQSESPLASPNRSLGENDRK